MPETSKVIVLVDLSKEISTLCTWIEESLEPQLEKPFVLMISVAKALPQSAKDARATIDVLIFTGQGQTTASVGNEVVLSEVQVYTSDSGNPVTKRKIV